MNFPTVVEGAGWKETEVDASKILYLRVLNAYAQYFKNRRQGGGEESNLYVKFFVTCILWYL